MIIGVGSDLIDIARIASLLKRYPQRFSSRVFTPVEQETALSSLSPAASYAKRFAAKEAFVKALGTGISQGITWKDIEVVNLKGGKPSLNIDGAAKRYLETLVPYGKTVQVHISITDSQDIAAAIVIIALG